MITLFLNFLGTGEFFLIALVFLLLFGPEKIPILASSMGKFIRKVKEAGNDIKKEIHASSHHSNIINEINDNVEEVKTLSNSLKREVSENIDNK